MAEVGIDISAHTSARVDRYVNDDLDLVLTLCDSAREYCPAFPGAERKLHHSFEDPDNPNLTNDQLLPGLRHIRYEIGEYIRELLHTLYSDAK